MEQLITIILSSLGIVFIAILLLIAIFGGCIKIYFRKQRGIKIKDIVSPEALRNLKKVNKELLNSKKELDILIKQKTKQQ